MWVNESLDELQQHGWNWSSRMRLNMTGKLTHEGWNWWDKQKNLSHVWSYIHEIYHTNQITDEWKWIS